MAVIEWRFYSFQADSCVNKIIIPVAHESYAWGI